MPRPFRKLLPLLLSILVVLSLAGAVPVSLRAQSGYSAQLSGVIRDSSGGVVPDAKITLTDEDTGIARTYATDARGIYVFTGVRPATYSIRVESPNFATQERKGLTLAVSQQASLDFSLSPKTVSEVVQVTEQAPLLDTGNASLGTDVTNEYVRDIPLVNRSFFGLVFLAGGVTETAGQGTEDSYPAGTNFVSNGQRNSTAEIRVDGALTSAPEQGEGATTNVYYQPSVEIVQEFKVENNSFSAEYGNNGGTVVNVVLKEGKNKFHGSGWWFGQRSAMDANEFFRNKFDIPNPDHARDQYGFSLGGPIKKEKTFFFVDFEKTRQNDPVNIDAFVPTALERAGDFRNTQITCSDAANGCTPGVALQQHIFNPLNVTVDAQGNVHRQDFAIPNVIDTGLIDPIGQAIINLYPQPTVANAGPGEFNYHDALLSKFSARQFDIKVDHHFSDKNRISGRYSNHHDSGNVPTIFGDGDFGDGSASSTDVHNAVIESNWSPTPTTVVTSRFSVDRAVQPVTENYPTLSDVNLPSVLGNGNGISRIPVIQMDNNATSLFNQCCTDTRFAHSLYSYGSSLSWVRGRHIWKFGGEQRLFFNNFSQPNPPTGFFHFATSVTEQDVGGGNTDQGNSFAGLLLGYGDTDSFYAVNPSVANKSKDTAFYLQDDWKVNSKLTVNLGLRYEWSSPYSERHNHIQFSDFTGASGITVPIDVPGVLTRTDSLLGTTIFPNSGYRNARVDRNNWAPRLGFAYTLNPSTVVRGGAGLYYGLSVATNFQFTGTAFGNFTPIRFTKDNFETQFATLADPFPGSPSVPQPQGTKYADLALWGFPNNNSLDTGKARNAEIYQWNFGVQHLFPGQFVIGVDYSASRSTHLPYSSFSGTANRNFLPSAIRNQLVAAMNPGHDPTNTDVSNFLNGLVANPFQPLFQGPNAIFNEPDSIYNDGEIPAINLLRPFPQFDGPFSGLTLLTASAAYHSLQVRFQKRPSHYISFEGNYTLSKATDNSSAGANSFITQSLSSGNPQELDNLRAEHSISANDATHRMVVGVIAGVPVGRNRWIGKDMNRVLDAIVGGWSISTILTFQSGTPISMGLADARLADGSQRPDVVCSQLSSGLSYHTAASTDSSVFNAGCFADPGDQIAGNAPRYFSNLRSDGIHNIDLSLSKEFTIREDMKLQIRGEFFNFTNTPRFNVPNTAFGDSQFGQVTSTLGSPRRTQVGVRFEF